MKLIEQCRVDIYRPCPAGGVITDGGKNDPGAMRITHIKSGYTVSGKVAGRGQRTLQKELLIELSLLLMKNDAL